jgi:hypothetical protein
VLRSSARSRSKLRSPTVSPAIAIEVSSTRLSSIFASSAASLIRRIVAAWVGSLRLSFTPSVLSSRPSAQSTIAQSKSRPPRKLSPSCPTTRSKPSRVSSSDTSKVPPPRS